MLEIRVSTEEEQAAVVAAMQSGRLGELLGERGFVVRTERNGHLQTVAGYGRSTSNTVIYAGPAGIGGIGGAGGTGSTSMTSEPPEG